MYAYISIKTDLVQNLHEKYSEMYLEILYFQSHKIHVWKWVCRVKLILICFILLNLYTPENYCFPNIPIIIEAKKLLLSEAYDVQVILDVFCC